MSYHWLERLRTHFRTEPDSNAADRRHTAANRLLRPPKGGPATYLANGAAATREL